MLCERHTLVRTQQAGWTCRQTYARDLDHLDLGPARALAPLAGDARLARASESDAETSSSTTRDLVPALIGRRAQARVEDPRCHPPARRRLPVFGHDADGLVVVVILEQHRIRPE